jgi:hypothetical protein
MFQKNLILLDILSPNVTSHHLADRFESRSRKDMELVMIAGRVQLYTEAALEWPRFTAKRRLKHLMNDVFMRWLRATVNTSVQKLKEAPGKAESRPGCRNIRFPAGVETENGG